MDGRRVKEVSTDFAARRGRGGVNEKFGRQRAVGGRVAETRKRGFWATTHTKTPGPGTDAA